MRKQNTLASLVVCILAASAVAADSATTTRPAPPSDLKPLHQAIAKGEVIPFSFELNGKPARLVRASVHEGKTEARVEAKQADWHALAVEYREESGAMKVVLNCTFAPAFELMRSTVTLKAAGEAEPHLGTIRILDLELPNAESAMVHGITGGGLSCDFPPKSFSSWSREVRQGQDVHLDSDRDGRSSNSELPVWLLHVGDAGGFWFGPEWSGCWDMNAGREANAVHVNVGLPTFDFVMRRGETITLPTVTWGTYAGPATSGFNTVRRTIAEHYLPRIGGKKPQPMVYFQGYWGHPSYQDEPTMYREAERAGQVGCEAFVLDGAWNNAPDNTDWPSTVGDWEDHGRFPSGVRKFGDMVKSKGMRFGIWIEPRAVAGTPMREQHPDLFTGDQFDLGKPEGQKLFEETMDHLVRDFGADFIWIDYNIGPRPTFWDKMEQPDRKGLLELGFYQGWYRALENTLAKHPNVWIEGCASGGRIIDLGQIRVCHSFWVIDDPVYFRRGADLDDCYNRNIRDGLNLLLPAVCIQNSLFRDSYVLTERPPADARLGGGHRFLTHFSGDMGLGQGLCFWRPEEIREAAQYAAIFKQHRAYLEKDYYHLLAAPASLNAWDAWQYDDRDGDSGILCAFRLKDSPEQTLTLSPNLANRAKDYQWSVVAGAGEVRATDKGLDVTLAQPGAVLVHYRR